MTPTYSGCPATRVITMDIETALRDHGIDKLRIETPALAALDHRLAVRQGPRQAGGLRHRPAQPPPAARTRCPRCGGAHLEKVSQFGSTPCKAQWRCRDCLEPFDYFKCI